MPPEWFFLAAASNIWSFPDWLPYLVRGEANGISYLGVLAVLMEVSLGLSLIFSNSKDLLIVAAMLVLVVFTGYLSYACGFMDEEGSECGQLIAANREGRLWFSLTRNSLLLDGLALHVRTTWLIITN